MHFNMTFFKRVSPVRPISWTARRLARPNGRQGRKEGQSNFRRRGSSQMLARRGDRYVVAMQQDGDAAVVMNHRHFTLHGDGVAFR